MNYEEAIASAQQCATRTEFKLRFKDAYTWLSKQKRLSALDVVMPKQVRQAEQITLEGVLAKVRRYRTRTEFMANCKRDYAWLVENDKVAELDKLRPRLNAVSDVVTLDYVLERAQRCSSFSEFICNYYRLYVWAKGHAFLSKVEAVLPRATSSEISRHLSEANSPYTEEEMIEDAKRFKTRAYWRADGIVTRQAGGFSCYGSATKRGRDFMRQCCAHMIHGAVGLQRNLRYSDEELIQSAKPYQHRKQWKTAQKAHYSAAWHRGILDQCCAHMTPAASPYAGDYVVYAYEFADHHVYVGITFVSDRRQVQHRVTGPVFDHAILCQEYTHKIVEHDLPSPQAAGEAEKKWIDQYQAEGWALLNKAKPGGTGGIHTKWDKETVCAEARKYATKQEWIDKSQFTYRLAKKMGWFDEASAHMPKRVLGVGLGAKRSAETRQKQKEIAQRRAADPKWRAAHSAALKGRNLTPAHREALKL